MRLLVHPVNRRGRAFDMENNWLGDSVQSEIAGLLQHPGPDAVLTTLVLVNVAEAYLATSK